MASPNYILAFLEHRGLDYQHRTLKEVWAFSDDEIERTHDFIQWVFPTTEPSKNVIGSPVLSSEELALVRASKKAKDSIVASSEWFMDFLSRRDEWRLGYDHNHLRVTRMLQSITLVGKTDNAKIVLDRILQFLNGEDISRNILRATELCENVIAED